MNEADLHQDIDIENAKQFPKAITSFAEELLDLCRKHDLNKFHATIRGNYIHDAECRNWDEISFRWESGRHGAAMNRIHLSAKKEIRAEIKSGQAWPG